MEVEVESEEASGGNNEGSERESKVGLESEAGSESEAEREGVLEAKSVAGWETGLEAKS